MNCPNCGTTNPIENKYCISCGNSLIVQPHIENQTQNFMQYQNNTYQQSTQNIQSSMSYTQQNITTPNSNPIHSPTNLSIMEIIFMIISVILKPYTTRKEKIKEFDNSKNSFFFASIVTIFFTIVSLIKTMLSAVIVKNYSFLNGTTTKWVWGNLKELNYIQTIGKNLLLFVGMILAITILYYIASLIVKKETKWIRLLGISAVAITPMFLSILILSPLLTIISAPLGIGISIIGIVYTIIILYEMTNQEIPLEGNNKYYFNLICLSVLANLYYYILIKIINPISSNMSNILDLFR